MRGIIGAGIDVTSVVVRKGHDASYVYTPSSREICVNMTGIG